MFMDFQKRVGVTIQFLLAQGLMSSNEANGIQNETKVVVLHAASSRDEKYE